MNYQFSGIVHVFGRNIDTDQIYPAKYLEYVDTEEIAKHCLEGADSSFAGNVKPGDIVAAGTNFGCGSSREHAAITLLSAGVSVVVAESFARIFYRNSINLALPLLVCPGISAEVNTGETLDVDIREGTVILENGKVLQAEKLSEHALEILNAGGIKNMIRQKSNHNSGS